MASISEPIFPTDVGSPGQVAVYRISHNSVSLRWPPPAGEVENYIVTCREGQQIVRKLTTTDTNITVTDLEQETFYALEVSAELADGSISEPALTLAYTGEGTTFQNKVNSLMFKSN